mgnify:CR=1 FL=1
MLYMIKIVNGKTRYYNLDLQINLFGEYIVINTYGSIYNKTHTGVIVNYFNSKYQAEYFFKEEKQRKIKNGYKIKKG